MPDGTLSTQVIRRDQTLERAHATSQEELAKHRWRWTLDESNPKRVSIRQYARDVGRQFNAIHTMVHGYAAWINADQASLITLTECIARASVSVEREAAVDAVARARGTSFNGARQRHEEVKRVREMAEARAERHGTAVADELPVVAEQVVKADQANKAVKQRADERRRTTHTFAYIQIEGHLAAAKRKLTDALNEAADVGIQR